MTASAIYLGEVAHRRLRPKVHALRYRIFQLLLDLDEAEILSGQSRWFGFNRPALLSFHERDHGEATDRPLKKQIEDRLQDAGLAYGGPVRVLTMPRVLGYVFNPITLYFCHGPDGGLSAVIHEVNNTFGQRTFYVLPAAGGGPIRQQAEKTMHVSPFMDMDYRYDFVLAEPADDFTLAIRMVREGETWLQASFAGRRRAFTDRALFGAWLRHPLLTLKVIGAIHFEALRLWLKGIGFRPAPGRDETADRKAAA